MKYMDTWDLEAIFPGERNLRNYKQNYIIKGNTRI